MGPVVRKQTMTTETPLALQLFVIYGFGLMGHVLGFVAADAAGNISILDIGLHRIFLWPLFVPQTLWSIFRWFLRVWIKAWRV